MVIHYGHFCPASSELFRDGGADPFRFQLGEGVRTGAQRDVCVFEPLADVVIEGELDQADGVHWRYQRRDTFDGLFPDVLEVVSCGDGKEEGPVVLWRPSLAAAARGLEQKEGKRLSYCAYPW